MKCLWTKTFWETGNQPLPFKELTLSYCVQELQSSVVKLLMPTPNSITEVGYNRDRSVCLHDVTL